MLILKEKHLIGEGTGRKVYVHPDDETKCLKIPCQKKLIKKRMRRRNILSRIRPLRFWNPTKGDVSAWRKFQRKGRNSVFDHIPRCYGFQDTNHGEALVFDLITSEGRVFTLNDYLDKYGYTDEIKESLKEFYHFLLRERVHFSDWKGSNLLIRDGDSRPVIYAVDGFEVTEFIPITLIPYFSRRKVHRRYKRYSERLKRRWGGNHP